MDLDLHDITYTYPRFSTKGEETFSLSGINLRISAGRITLLAGAPATGKSTLCRILQGVIPAMSGGTLNGSIELDGHDFHSMPAGERIEYISMAGQNPEEQIICNRVDEEAAFALESLGLPAAEIALRMNEAFSLTGISHLRDRQPATLSGGEKKKLLIACVLAIDPRIYIFDETLEEVATEFRTAILSRLKKQKKTVLLTTSRLHGEYLPWCSSFACLSSGGVVQDSEAGNISRQLEAQGLVLSALAAKEQPLPQPAKDARPVIEVDSVEFCYEGNDGFKLDISEFRVKQGECVAFVGDNGSGKTTFAKIITGLLKPKKGSCRLTGKEMAFSALSAHCGYIFQNPDYQLFLPTVADELNAGGTRPKDHPEACRIFGLPSPESPAAILSYGTRKKLQAAVFYGLPRELVILDEADSGLSPFDILDIIRKFHGKGSAVILITHDQGLAGFIAHRTIAFKDGRITGQSGSGGAKHA